MPTDHISRRLRLPQLVFLGAAFILILTLFTPAAQAEQLKNTAAEGTTENPAEVAGSVVCPEGEPPESGLCYVDDSLFLESRLPNGAGHRPGPNSATTPGAQFTPLNMFRNKVVCFGDGADGRRIQIIYLRPDTVKTATPTSRIHNIAAGVATTYEESSRAHGGAVKTPRFVHDKNCRPVIETVTIPKATLDGGAYSITGHLAGLGFDRADRKYLVFIEYQPFCGLATHYIDERPNPAVNQSNNHTGYALNGSGCWEYAAAHELTHALGAVNRNAPNSSGHSHCLDDYDLMCYKDQSGKKTVIRCTDRSWEYLLDCGGDDYFNPNPAPGSYLSTKWNIYNSGFLGSVSDDSQTARPSDSVGLYDPEGRVRVITPTIRGLEGTDQFYYGNPGDYLFAGDWDCDGVPTPGMYRRSDGFVYLRNSNTPGYADISFYFGSPGDIPIAGDFNGNGCDTVSVYRPSNATFYIINKLGQNGKGLGWAEYSFVFGHHGDVPFVGDFDGDGVDTIGLHRPSTGQVFIKNKLSSGWADLSFIFGHPGDMLTAGDWDGDGVDTVAVYRPSNGMLYLKNSNRDGWADAELHVGPARGVAGFRR